MQLHLDILGPAMVNGVALASLYGLMAVALVLTFRMSRSVAFVHGGVGTVAAYLFWYLSANSVTQATYAVPRIPALLFVMLVSAVLSGLFGSIVMGRMATWPRVTVTTFSLGAMLFAIGIVGTIWRGIFERVPSPFGVGQVRMLGTNISRHQLLSILILVVVVLVLAFVLSRTRLGIYIRAIADDVEAAEMVGIPMRRVAIGVWAFSGAVAGCAGVLIVPMTQLTEIAVLLVVLRSLAAAVLGGFDSTVLALAGGIVFGVIESTVGGGVFGTVSSGAREVLLMTVLFGSVVLLARRRKGSVALLQS